MAVNLIAADVWVYFELILFQSKWNRGKLWSVYVRLKHPSGKKISFLSSRGDMQGEMRRLGYLTKSTESGVHPENEDGAQKFSLPTAGMMLPAWG